MDDSGSFLSIKIRIEDGPFKELNLFFSRWIGVCMEVADLVSLLQRVNKAYSEVDLLKDLSGFEPKRYDGRRFVPRAHLERVFRMYMSSKSWSKLKERLFAIEMQMSMRKAEGQQNERISLPKLGEERETASQDADVSVDSFLVTEAFHKFMLILPAIGVFVKAGTIKRSPKVRFLAQLVKSECMSLILCCETIMGRESKAQAKEWRSHCSFLLECDLENTMRLNTFFGEEHFAEGLLRGTWSKVIVDKVDGLIGSLERLCVALEQNETETASLTMERKIRE